MSDQANRNSQKLGILKALKAGENSFLFRLFTESPIGLNLCRMHDGLWLTSNKAFLNIIGYSEVEADGGLTYWDLTPRKYDKEEEIQLNQLKETGQYGPYEKEFIHKQGHLVWVRLNGFVTQIDGEQFIWSFIENISELKKFAEEKKKKEQQIAISAKLASLGTLAAGVGHEINNPLTVLFLTVDKLKNQIDNKTILSPTSFDTIYENLERIRNIVDSLKIYSRTDQNEGKQKSFRVHQIIEDSANLLTSIYKLMGVRISASLDSERDLVLGDPGKFQQVMINLLDNAKDATLEKSTAGKIVLSTAYDSLTKSIVIKITDSGSGIPANLKDKVFDVFFTTKPVGKGTGLGLGISAGLIQDMDGTLTFDSLEDQGTTFTITLPVQERKATSQKANQVSQEKVTPNGSGHYVLLVEDEPDLLDLLTHRLEQWGFRVIASANGQDALIELSRKTHSFTFLITDLNMPKMTGTQLLQEIETKNLGPIKTILLTGGASSDQIVEIERLQSNIDSTIDKALVNRKLGAVLAQILDADNKSMS